MLELEAAAALDPAISKPIGEHPLVFRIANGYLERTPSGGLHLLYRCTEPVEGNQKLASRSTADGGVQVLIETRGEGGWTVAAPSGGRTHPNGGEWQLLSGGIDTIVTITPAERDELLGFMRSFDELPRPTPTIPQVEPGSRGNTQDSTRPGDRFNAEHTWRDVLEPAGWQIHHLEGDETFWTRPGKDVRQGSSATTNFEGTDLLKVFTTSTAFSTDKTYDRFGAWAVLNGFGDDLRAAGRALVPERPPMPVEALLAAHSEPTEPEKRESPFVSFREILGRERKAEDWLVKPLLIAGGRMHVIYARGKSGKSLLSLEIAAAVTTSRPLFGSDPIEPLRIGYFDYEMTDDDLQERLCEMGYGDAGEELDASGLRYMLNAGRIPPLDTKEGGEVFVELCREERLDHVFIDTMTRAVIGELNSPDTFRALYRWTLAPLKEARIGSSRIAHAGKDEKKGQIGSSMQETDVDLIWNLTVDRGTVRLKCAHTRVRYVQQGSVVTLKRHDEPLWHELVDGGGKTIAQQLADDLLRIGAPLDSRPKAQAFVAQWNIENPADEIPGRRPDTWQLALNLAREHEARSKVDALL